MANLNKVMLIGRLGQDPEIRYTQSGSAVANTTIATNDYWTDKQGEKQERTEWHSLVLWGRLADLAQSYLKKGSQVYVEGRLQTRDWEDQQGQKHYKTEVVVTNMQFLDSKNVDERNSSGRRLFKLFCNFCINTGLCINTGSRERPGNST